MINKISSMGATVLPPVSPPVPPLLPPMEAPFMESGFSCDVMSVSQAPDRVIR